MKKIFLTLAAVMIGHCSNAQTYLPLTAGSGNSLSGDLYLSRSANSNPQYRIIDGGVLITKLQSAGSRSFGYVGTESNHDFVIGTGNNNRVYITSGGNVGIGTESPSSLLQINGVTNIRTNTSTDGYISINPGSSACQGYINWWKPGGTRVGYMGYTDGTSINNLALTLEASANFIVNGGNVGIGTTTPDTKLAVNGTIHTKEVKVDLSVTGPDYVFEPAYKLPKLNELKDYLDKNHHLPEIPSAAQMAKEGISLGDMNIKLLKKVEELTLYLIEKDKMITGQQQQLTSQQQQINLLKQQLDVITKKLK